MGEEEREEQLDEAGATETGTADADALSGEGVSDENAEETVEGSEGGGDPAEGAA